MSGEDRAAALRRVRERVVELAVIKEGLHSQMLQLQAEWQQADEELKEHRQHELELLRLPSSHTGLLLRTLTHDQSATQLMTPSLPAAVQLASNAAPSTAAGVPAPSPGGSSSRRLKPPAATAAATAATAAAAAAAAAPQPDTAAAAEAEAGTSGAAAGTSQQHAAASSQLRDDHHHQQQQGDDAMDVGFEPALPQEQEQLPGAEQASTGSGGRGHGGGTPAVGRPGPLAAAGGSGGADEGDAEPGAAGEDDAAPGGRHHAAAAAVGIHAAPGGAEEDDAAAVAAAHALAQQQHEQQQRIREAAAVVTQEAAAPGGVAAQQQRRWVAEEVEQMGAAAGAAAAGAASGPALDNWEEMGQRDHWLLARLPRRAGPAPRKHREWPAAMWHGNEALRDLPLPTAKPLTYRPPSAAVWDARQGARQPYWGPTGPGMDVLTTMESSWEEAVGASELALDPAQGIPILNERARAVLVLLLGAGGRGARQGGSGRSDDDDDEDDGGGFFAMRGGLPDAMDGEGGDEQEEGGGILPLWDEREREELISWSGSDDDTSLAEEEGVDAATAGAGQHLQEDGPEHARRRSKGAEAVPAVRTMAEAIQDLSRMRQMREPCGGVMAGVLGSLGFNVHGSRGQLVAAMLAGGEGGQGGAQQGRGGGCKPGRAAGAMEVERATEAAQLVEQYLEEMAQRWRQTALPKLQRSALQHWRRGQQQRRRDDWTYWMDEAKRQLHKFQEDVVRTAASDGSTIRPRELRRCCGALDGALSNLLEYQWLLELAQGPKPDPPSPPAAAAAAAAAHEQVGQEREQAEGSPEAMQRQQQEEEEEPAAAAANKRPRDESGAAEGSEPADVSEPVRKRRRAPQDDGEDLDGSFSDDDEEEEDEDDIEIDIVGDSDLSSDYDVVAALAAATHSPTPQQQGAEQAGGHGEVAAADEQPLAADDRQRGSGRADASPQPQTQEDAALLLQIGTPMDAAGMMGDDVEQQHGGGEEEDKEGISLHHDHQLQQHDVSDSDMADADEEAAIASNVSNAPLVQQQPQQLQVFLPTPGDTVECLVELEAQQQREGEGGGRTSTPQKRGAKDQRAKAAAPASASVRTMCFFKSHVEALLANGFAEIYMQHDPTNLVQTKLGMLRPLCPVSVLVSERSQLPRGRQLLEVYYDPPGAWVRCAATWVLPRTYSLGPRAKPSIERLRAFTKAVNERLLARHSLASGAVVASVAAYLRQRAGLEELPCGTLAARLEGPLLQVPGDGEPVLRVVIDGQVRTVAQGALQAGAVRLAKDWAPLPAAGSAAGGVAAKRGGRRAGPHGGAAAAAGQWNEPSAAQAAALAAEAQAVWRARVRRRALSSINRVMTDARQLMVQSQQQADDEEDEEFSPGSLGGGLFDSPGVGGGSQGPGGRGGDGAVLAAVRRALARNPHIDLGRARLDRLRPRSTSSHTWWIDALSAFDRPLGTSLAASSGGTGGPGASGSGGGGLRSRRKGAVARQAKAADRAAAGGARRIKQRQNAADAAASLAAAERAAEREALQEREDRKRRRLSAAGLGLLLEGGGDDDGDGTGLLGLGGRDGGGGAEAAALLLVGGSERQLPLPEGDGGEGPPQPLFKTSKGDQVMVPGRMARSLKQHQWQGLRWLWKKLVIMHAAQDEEERGGCILAHSMGLGKSLQSVAFLSLFFDYHPNERCLLVVPTSVLLNWQEEFRKWLPNKPRRDGRGLTLDKVMLPSDKACELPALVEKWSATGSAVLLLNYERFRNAVAARVQSGAAAGKTPGRTRKGETDVQRLARMDSNKEAALRTADLLLNSASVVVADEAHTLKNIKGKIYKSFEAINTTRRLALTGYPLQNRMSEYYAMMTWVQRDLLGSAEYFKDEYEKPISKVQDDPDPSEDDLFTMNCALSNLDKLVGSYIHRKGPEVLERELPTLRQHLLLMRMSDLQHRAYAAYLEAVDNRRQLFRDKCWLERLMDFPRQHKQALEDCVARGGQQATEAAMAAAAAHAATGSVATTAAEGAAAAAAVPIAADSTAGGTAQEPRGAGAEGAGGAAAAAATGGTAAAVGGGGAGSEGREGEEEEGPDEGENLSGQVDDTDVHDEAADCAVDDDGGRGPSAKHDYRLPPSVSAGLLRRLKDDEEKSGVTLEEQCSPTPKVRLLMRLVDWCGRQSPPERLVVFGSRVAAMDEVEAQLQQALGWRCGQEYMRLKGETKAKQRHSDISAFNAGGVCNARVFLISTEAGSHGINLTTTCHLALLDANWNPVWNAQAVCRIWRYGQTRPTHVYHLHYAQTLQEAIFLRHRDKHALFKRVVDGQTLKVTKNKSLDERCVYTYHHTDPLGPHACQQLARNLSPQGGEPGPSSGGGGGSSGGGCGGGVAGGVRGHPALVELLLDPEAGRWLTGCTDIQGLLQPDPTQKLTVEQRRVAQQRALARGNHNQRQQRRFILESSSDEDDFISSTTAGAGKRRDASAGQQQEGEEEEAGVAPTGGAEQQQHRADEGEDGAAPNGGAVQQQQQQEEQGKGAGAAPADGAAQQQEAGASAAQQQEQQREEEGEKEGAGGGPAGGTGQQERQVVCGPSASEGGAAAAAAGAAAGAAAAPSRGGDAASAAAMAAAGAAAAPSSGGNAASAAAMAAAGAAAAPSRSGDPASAAASAVVAPALQGRTMPKGREAIGWKVGVYRVRQMCFEEGHVMGYDAASGKHLLRSDAGGKLQYLALAQEHVKWMSPPQLETKTQAGGLQGSQEEGDSEEDEGEGAAEGRGRGGERQGMEEEEQEHGGGSADGAPVPSGRGTSGLGGDTARPRKPDGAPVPAATAAGGDVYTPAAAAAVILAAAAAAPPRQGSSQPTSAASAPQAAGAAASASTATAAVAAKAASAAATVAATPAAKRAAPTSAQGAAQGSVSGGQPGSVTSAVAAAVGGAASANGTPDTGGQKRKRRISFKTTLEDARAALGLKNSPAQNGSPAGQQQQQQDWGASAGQQQQEQQGERPNAVGAHRQQGQEQGASATESGKEDGVKGEEKEHGQGVGFEPGQGSDVAGARRRRRRRRRDRAAGGGDGGGDGLRSEPQQPPANDAVAPYYFMEVHTDADGDEREVIVISD